MEQDSTAKSLQYVPGVCNIGHDERAMRRRSGIFGAIVTVIIFAILVKLGAPKPWRWILVLPASAAASGFLQDAFHFCAGFGLKGLYNVANSAGKTDTVTQAKYRQADKRKAIQIIGLSLLIGLAVAAISMR